jgi:hypothetical protein
MSEKIKTYKFIGNTSISFSHCFCLSKEGNVHVPLLVFAFGRDGFLVYLLGFGLSINRNA